MLDDNLDPVLDPDEKPAIINGGSLPGGIQPDGRGGFRRVEPYQAILVVDL